MTRLDLLLHRPVERPESFPQLRSRHLDVDVPVARPPDAVYERGQEGVPVRRGVTPCAGVCVLDGEELRMIDVTDERANVLQRSKCHYGVRGGVAFEQTRFRETQRPTDGVRVTRTLFVHREFGYGRYGNVITEGKEKILDSRKTFSFLLQIIPAMFTKFFKDEFIEGYC